MTWYINFLAWMSSMISLASFAHSVIHPGPQMMLIFHREMPPAFTPANCLRRNFVCIFILENLGDESINQNFQNIVLDSQPNFREKLSYALTAWPPKPKLIRTLKQIFQDGCRLTCLRMLGRKNKGEFVSFCCSFFKGNYAELTRPKIKSRDPNGLSFSPAHKPAREFLGRIRRFRLTLILQLTLSSGPGMEFKLVLDLYTMCKLFQYHDCWCLLVHGVPTTFCSTHRVNNFHQRMSPLIQSWYLVIQLNLCISFWWVCARNT